MTQFRLFALSNCPYCHTAIQFLQENKMPGEVIWADNDPIVDAGIVARTGQNRYPVLLSRLTTEIIVGWKPEDYERLNKVWTTLVRTGSLDMADSRLVTGGEGQAAPAEAIAGAE